MYQSIYQRIEEYFEIHIFEATGASIRSVARELEMEEATLRSQIRGRTNFKLDLLEKIDKLYPGIVRYVFGGDSNKNSITFERHHSAKQIISKEFSNHITKENPHASIETFQVIGDKMEPTLFDSDIVLAEECDPEDISYNQLYVVHTERFGIQIHRLKTDREKVFCRLDKKTVEPYMIRKSDIRHIWSIKAVLTQILPGNYGPKRSVAIDEDLFDLRHSISLLTETIKKSRNL
jgi:hypothetical protein